MLQDRLSVRLSSYPVAGWAELEQEIVAAHLVGCA